MNTRHEPERREGLGGRVRRFVDHELNRVLEKDKEDSKDQGGPGSEPRQADYRREPDQAPEFDRHQEPVTPYADTPGRASHPVTTAPVGPGYDTPEYSAPAHDPKAEKAETGQFSGRSSDAAPAEGNAERVGLLDDPASLRDQWQRVQGTFVDDPQRAVQEASVLVERTLHEIQENISRSQLSDRTSTEDLRVSFQRYREFFQRLLSA